MTAKKYDYIIVGTGFASSFFLKKLLEKEEKNTGLKVLVLERGQLYKHRERLQYTHEILKGHEVQELKATDYKTTYQADPHPWKDWRFELAFGGGSNCWWACTPRLLPNDFRMQTAYGVAQDWPITYEDLEPYYEEAEQVMAISGPEKVAWPKRGAYPQPPHIMNTVDRLLNKKYGDEVYFTQPTARARKPVGERGACCATGVCTLCPANAKFTVENTLLQIYKDKRITIEYGANVTHLELTGDTAKKVYYAKDGQQMHAEAEIFVLGANALFNSNILMNSGDTSSLLGKGLIEQVSWTVILYMDGFANVGSSTSNSALGYMLYDGEHRKRRAAALIESHNDMGLVFARPHKERRGKWRDIAAFKFVFEDLPQAENQVMAQGIDIQPQIKYTNHSDYTRKGYEYLRDNAEKLFEGLPLEKVIVEERPNSTENHLQCSHRMGSNPQESVVDKHSLHHKYRNLFVLGSGSFTTCPPANPSLTISALSLLAADKTL